MKKITKGVVLAGALLVCGGGGVYASSIIHVTPKAPKAISSPTALAPVTITTNPSVHVVSTETQHWSLSQAEQALSRASDPGLPPIVGTVDGKPITSKEMAQMEVIMIHRQGHGTIGSSTLRTQAFVAIETQYLEEIQAQRLGLLPPRSVAQQQVITRGLPNTPQEISLVQLSDGAQALVDHVLGPHGQSESPVWRHYVQQLLNKATVVRYVKF
jgi:hypothetical protein